MKTLFLLLALLPSLAFADVDSELNETYQQVLKHRKDYADHIKKSQIDWLKFIKSDCNASSLVLSSRVMYAAEFDACIEEHKKTATKYLKKLI